MAVIWGLVLALDRCGVTSAVRVTSGPVILACRRCVSCVLLRHMAVVSLPPMAICRPLSLWSPVVAKRP